MQVLSGKQVAEARRQQIKQECATFTKVSGRKPGLAVILVGDDPASHVYVANKIKACHEVGITSSEHRLAADVSKDALKAQITKLNADLGTDGILLQLPLPKHLNAEESINWIDPDKDADCLTVTNLGKLWIGRALTIPCTPWGVMVMLEHYKINVSGMNAVVVGRSNIVGKPMAHLLNEANATVTICHSKTANLLDHTKRADLIVVAVGKPEMLGKEAFRQDAIVIDVGIHRKVDKKLCGDVRFQELEGHVKAATPVPGGVGPMTITMLMENTLRLAQKRLVAAAHS